MSTTTLSAQDYEKAVSGANFRNILEIIDLLKNFDLSKLRDLLDAIKEITAATTVVARIKAALKTLAIIAEMTPTETDDKIVEVIRSIASDELLEIIARLVGGMLGGSAQTQDVTILAADRRTAAAAGIPWTVLVGIALQIARLLEGLNLGNQMFQPDTPSPKKA